MRRRRERVVGLVCAVLCVLVAGAGPVAGEDSRRVVTSSAPYAAAPVEDYAGYQPQTACKRNPKPGVLLLADFLVARGGGYGPISRSCEGGGTSEHKESRAFDWMLDANDPVDQAIAQAFLDEVLAPDDTGEPHAIARRMGIMYVLWDDRMWASYDGFAEERYLSSSCRSRRSCSPTLRHRDHMHISLTRKAARGLTSWYLAQVPPPTAVPAAVPTAVPAAPPAV